MASPHTQMQQQYCDDAKDGSAGVHAPLLPTAALPAHPRWMHEDKQLDKSHRRLKLTLGALAVTYLLYCGWVAYSRHETYVRHHESSEVDVFPHPFPRPPRRPHHPPGPPPAISVLGCVLIPDTNNEDFVSEKVKLSVSYATNATVVLHNKLLFGDLAIEKVGDEKGDEELMESTKESTLNVAIKVAARPPFPGHLIDQETGEEEKFVLCATTFAPHPRPPHLEIEGEHPPAPPHPHGHPHGPPVIVDIFPALNETYPKLPPPPPFPHHRPGGHHHHHHRHHKSKLSAICRATISFLFPMFTELPNDHTSHPCPGAPHPPPFPPFIVTSVSATIPKTSHVVYGLPPPPPPFFRFPHSHHPRLDDQ